MYPKWSFVGLGPVMSVSKATMFSVVALSLVTGAGVALNFGLLDNDTTWLPVAVAVVSVGACPFAAGWLSHRLTNVALFSASVLVVSQLWNRKGKGGEVWIGRPGF